jgi:hypothetical protein
VRVQRAIARGPTGQHPSQRDRGTLDAPGAGTISYPSGNTNYGHAVDGAAASADECARVGPGATAELLRGAGPNVHGTATARQAAEPVHDRADRPFRPYPDHHRDPVRPEASPVARGV